MCLTFHQFSMKTNFLQLLLVWHKIRVGSSCRNKIQLIFREYRVFNQIHLCWLCWVHQKTSTLLWSLYGERLLIKDLLPEAAELLSFRFSTFSNTMRAVESWLPEHFPYHFSRPFLSQYYWFRWQEAQPLLTDGEILSFDKQRTILLGYKKCQEVVLQGRQLILEHSYSSTSVSSTKKSRTAEMN